MTAASTPTLAHAIRCLEDELARQLERAGAVALELRTLRELAGRDLRPAESPLGDVAAPAEPEPAPVASSAVGSGSPALVRPPATGAPADPVVIPKTKKSRSTARAGGSRSSTSSPPAESAGGLPRPATHDCLHCDKSFGSPQGLSLHITRTHPIERKKFDPDAARARAASAMDGDGGISKMNLGGRPKASAA